MTISTVEEPSQSRFGSSDETLPDHIPMVREELVPPKPNEVRAESEVDKLPRPTGWRLLIIPYAQPRMSQGGILYSNKTVNDEELAGIVGYVVTLGPLAYKDPNKFGEDAEPWCKKGDYIIYGKYAGKRMLLREEGSEIKGIPCRIINDDEVIAVISDPADYVGLT